MVFNAAKDLVYTMNGGNISSGGYRINKIINSGKSKKKGKQTQDGGAGYSSIFKEDSGIPIGLLLMQRLHENEHDNGDIIANCKNKNKENNATLDENENKKLVYASIMAESDDDGDGRGIELVIMPSGIANPIEISSNEIDNELYDSLVKSVMGPEQMMVSTPTPLRKANATKKQNFEKHDIKTIYKKEKGKKTRKRRH
jgi:hypothetical protein